MLKTKRFSKRTNGWKAGWRIIGDKEHYYRSRWEANYARYLQKLKEISVIKEWEFEPQTFWFNAIKRGVTSYLPDFLITECDGKQYFVELKGYMDPKSKTKLKRMKRYYPEVDLRLVGARDYKDLESRCAQVLPGWEV